MAGSGRAARWLAIAAGWTLVITVLLTNAAYYWPLSDDDDPYISFRYAWNLLHGKGLVWNPGEHFQGYSNFLWVMLNAAVFPVTRDFLLGARLLSTLSILVIIVAGAYWLRPLVRGFAFHAWLMVYALLVAACSPLIRYAVNGWEMALFPALLMAALVRYDREMSDDRKVQWSVLLAFAMTVTRSEGPLHLITFFVFRAALLRRGVAWRRQDWMWLCRLGVLLAAYAAFQLVYFGSVKTGPYYAKMAAQPGHAYGREYLLGVFLYTHHSVFPLFAAIGTAMAWAAARRALLLWFMPCLLQMALIWWFDGDMWPDFRLFAGFYPLLYLGLVTGCARYIQQKDCAARRRRLAHVGIALLAVFTALEQYMVASTACARFKLDGTLSIRRRAALHCMWLKPDPFVPRMPEFFCARLPIYGTYALPMILGNTLPEESIVFPDIGFVGLVTRCRLLDPRGLTDPDAAMSAYHERRGETELAEQAAMRFLEKVEQLRPPFIATGVHGPPANRMLRDSAFLRDNYVRIGGINIHDYHVRRDRLDQPLSLAQLQWRWLETIALFPRYGFLKTGYLATITDYRKSHR
jgi:hypothetical protein